MNLILVSNTFTNVTPFLSDTVVFYVVISPNMKSRSSLDSYIFIYLLIIFYSIFGAFKILFILKFFYSFYKYR